MKFTSITSCSTLVFTLLVAFHHFSHGWKVPRKEMTDPTPKPTDSNPPDPNAPAQPIMGIPKECCLSDKPENACDNYKPTNPTGGATSTITTAVFDPNQKGDERLHVFFADRVFTFYFKDEARNTPILEEAVKNQFRWKHDKEWNMKVDEVLYAYSTEDEVTFNVVVKSGDKEEVVKMKYTKEDLEKEISPASQKGFDSPPFFFKKEEDKDFFAAAHMKVHGSKGGILALYGKRDFNPENTFDYRVKLWDIASGDVKLETTIKGGRVVAIAGRRSLAVEGQAIVPSRGLYFTNDGRVCPFDLDPPPNEKKELQFEKMGDYPPPCWSFQTFIGCPPSFCYQGDIDDMAFHDWGTGSGYLIFREKFFWRVDGQRGKLPIAAPKITERKFVEFQLQDEEGGPKLEQAMELVDGAFSYVDEAGPKLYVIKENMVKYYEAGLKPYTDTDRVFEVFNCSGCNPDHVEVIKKELLDTAVYDDAGSEPRLWMFWGEYWGQFKRIPGTINEWEVDGGKLRNKTEDFQDAPLFFEGSIDGDEGLYLTFGSFLCKYAKGKDPKEQSCEIYPSLVTTASDTRGIFHLEGCTVRGVQAVEPSKLYNQLDLNKPGKVKDYVELVKSKQSGNMLTYVLITLVVTIMVVAFVLMLGAVLLIAHQKKGKKPRGPKTVKSTKSSMPKFKYGK